MFHYLESERREDKFQEVYALPRLGLDMLLKLAVNKL
jgi:hypothetical protein